MLCRVTFTFYHTFPWFVKDFDNLVKIVHELKKYNCTNQKSHILVLLKAFCFFNNEMRPNNSRQS